MIKMMPKVIIKTASKVYKNKKFPV